MMRINFRKLEAAKELEGFKCIAGIDEVGRGSFAGPMVVGMVVYNESLLKLRGLNDSKLVKRGERTKLFKKIINQCEYSLGIAWPEEIDEYGISKCLQLCVDRAFYSLNEHYGVRPDFLFIDGRVKLELDGVSIENHIKGDQKIRCIAAGSIIAKVFRDTLMAHYKSLFNEFNWASHVGYGTLKHRQNIAKVGVTRIHRKSFLKNIINA